MWDSNSYYKLHDIFSIVKQTICNVFFFFCVCLCVCSATVVEDSFSYLDAPVERIAGADVPTPYAANLERLAFPQVVFRTPTFLFKVYNVYIK